MSQKSLIHQLLAIADEESGGDNALDGFEFQVSSAIHLIFSELKSKKEFSLIYEKIEDFIIVNDIITLYQAKSVSNNLTPRILHKPSKITKNDSTGLSIIEKMYTNYTKIMDSIKNTEVKTYLLIDEAYNFSKKLSKNYVGIDKLKTLNFNELSLDTKNEIIKATKFNKYNWDKINAVRLIPKSRHEEVTRVHIEDTITELLGDNKINSTALYNALTYEIRRIRKNKSSLDNSFLIDQIHRYATLEDDLNFKDYVYLLSEKDRRNIQINLYFNEMKNYILIESHPIFIDYLTIKEFFSIKDIESVDKVYVEIKTNNIFSDLTIRLNDHEVKALILLIVAKELN